MMLWDFQFHFNSNEVNSIQRRWGTREEEKDCTLHARRRSLIISLICLHTFQCFIHIIYLLIELYKYHYVPSFEFFRLILLTNGCANFSFLLHEKFGMPFSQ